MQKAYVHICGAAEPRHPRSCMAAVLHARACDTKAASSCAALAELYGSGRLDKRRDGRSIALHLRACAGGHAPSCGLLGRRYADGSGGVKRDAARAEVLLTDACERDEAAACSSLATLLARGNGTKLDVGGARRLREEACERGHGEACFELATMMRLGIGGERLVRQAVGRLERGCQLNSADACAALARAHRDGTVVAADPTTHWSLSHKAAGVFEQICNAGDPHGCTELGRLLRHGDGVAADRGRGLELHRDACRKGHGPACMAYVVRGPHRIGIDKEPAGATALVRACQARDGAACFALGWIGQEGVRRAGVAPLSGDAFSRGCQTGHAAACNAAGVAVYPADEPGRQWLTRACDRGYAPGCYHLALSLELHDDDGDATRSAALHERACKQGFGRACTRLGLMQRRGHGVALAIHEASASFHSGCDLGDARGCFERGVLLHDSGGDAAQGLRLFRRACRAGLVEGCTRLGLSLLRGRGVSKNADEAAATLEGSCKRGSARACIVLADLMKESDKPRAVTLLRDATARGEAICADGLAVCRGRRASDRVIRGWGRYDGEPALLITEQPTCGVWLERACLDARELLSRRCALGAESCFEAAALLRQHARAGLSSSLATAEALEMKGFSAARRGCLQGDAAACEQLSTAYADGRGTAKNESLAKRHNARACRLDPQRCP